MTDPAVGASVWASGNQVWSGNRGTLTAKATTNDRKMRRCSVWVSIEVRRATSMRSKLMWPFCAVRNTTAKIPTRRKAEPAKVKMKNLTAA